MSDGRDYGTIEPSEDDRPSTTSHAHPPAFAQRPSHVARSPVAFPIHAARAGEVIIGNIDDDGYLRATLDEMRGPAGERRCVRCGEAALAVIQGFDPVGCPAPGPEGGAS